MAQQAGADALGLVIYCKELPLCGYAAAAEIRAVIGPKP